MESLEVVWKYFNAHWLESFKVYEYVYGMVLNCLIRIVYGMLLDYMES